MGEAEIRLVKNVMGEVTCGLCAVSLEDDSEPKKLMRLMLFVLAQNLADCMLTLDAH